MKYLKNYKLFELVDTENETKSKSQLKRELWHKNNPDPKGTNLNVDELDKFGIPQGIKDMMSEWSIIHKSPYSKSFYSSDNISWTHKDDNSYRVSDHWNFKSNRDDRIHCKTDKVVPSNTHYSIGKYNRSKNIYNIILTEPTTLYVKKMEDHKKKLQYLQDPETIYKKRLFKNLINDKRVFVELTLNNGEKISGILNKYGGIGNIIKIINSDGDIIFSDNDEKVKSLIFKDESNNIIENPYL